ncbi:hypothetical protein GO456_17725 [Leclercia adecarboxylata]|nr:hypothetical protein [Leclercia adecarboxylata]
MIKPQTNPAEKANKTVFLMDVEPFKTRTIDTPIESFIYERELIEETDYGYIATTDCPGFKATYLRQDYVIFDTREEALIHLERVVLDKEQELEDELSKWQQFNRTIEAEIMKP